MNQVLYVADPDTPPRPDGSIAFVKGKGHEKFLQIAILPDGAKLPSHGLIAIVGNKVLAYEFDREDTTASKKLEDHPKVELDIEWILTQRLSIAMLWSCGWTQFDSLEDYFWFFFSPKQQIERAWDTFLQWKFNHFPPKLLTLEQLKKQLLSMRKLDIGKRDNRTLDTKNGFTPHDVATNIYGFRIWRMPNEGFTRYTDNTDTQFDDLVANGDLKKVPREINRYLFDKLAVSGKSGHSAWDVIVVIAGLFAAAQPSLFDWVFKDHGPRWILGVIAIIYLAFAAWGLIEIKNKQ